ncbi:MAG: hypothetical protein AAFS10_21765, partial [Myxococcota bacterium]
EYGLLILDERWLRSDTVRAFERERGLQAVLRAQQELLDTLARARGTSALVHSAQPAERRVSSRVMAEVSVSARG